LLQLVIFNSLFFNEIYNVNSKHEYIIIYLNKLIIT